MIESLRGILSGRSPPSRSHRSQLGSRVRGRGSCVPVPNPGSGSRGHRDLVEPGACQRYGLSAQDPKVPPAGTRNAGRASDAAEQDMPDDPWSAMSGIKAKFPRRCLWSSRATTRVTAWQCREKSAKLIPCGVWLVPSGSGIPRLHKRYFHLEIVTIIIIVVLQRTCMMRGECSTTSKN